MNTIENNTCVCFFLFEYEQDVIESKTDIENENKLFKVSLLSVIVN